MSDHVQGGTGVRAYPSAAKNRELGRPKKTWSSSIPHSRALREAEILAPPAGYAYPSTPLNAPRPLQDVFGATAVPTALRAKTGER